ncbi:MAG: 6-hydroxycyclohex-1-ene-1-carbonyl-CoA dehydrogenase [Deltaproteobacteria bacterium]|nr:6-hydroxycyclohex-1-ene-1-carbonyl-CoA dehydrogenase [Candidatus Anaeroferrophillus wilburensis]MBN2888877.1 6-hydroxycyclohex-1-ene-1-carbonyl-CoA dehydrogenase [Deltaproteobacteria bacterium]
MSEIPAKIQTWQMVKPGEMVRTEIDMPAIKAGEVCVKVAGCGICHTDLGYFYDGVPTVNEPPLTLGHEISGTVIGGDAEMIGKMVIIPAVMPCGTCQICKAGRGNRCLAQKMPGNSLGIYGGFSSHIVVPTDGVCVIEDLKGLPLSHYAVVADAGTTPYQAAIRAELDKPYFPEGDLVVVIGAGGGVGTYMTQIAKAMGAQVVIAVDVDDEKLQRACQYGADLAINVMGKTAKEVKGEIKAFAKERGVPHNFGWKIFECSGSKPGQALGLELLSFIGKMIIVGFNMVKHEYMISRLMAFDAELIGTWGCHPKYYPAVLEMVQSGKVAIEPFLETRPMSTIRESFAEVHAKPLLRRIVLEPDF